MINPAQYGNFSVTIKVEKLKDEADPASELIQIDELNIGSYVLDPRN